MKLIAILSIVLFSNIALARTKTICGPSDDRVFVASNTKVARIADKGENAGCTATMISRTCAITAGHCKRIMYKGEFNPPKSINRAPQPASKENTYLIDQDSIKYEYDGWSDKTGKDWAVFRFKKNESTGKYPGENGNFYEVDFDEPATVSDEVTIYGFGIDKNDNDLHAALQVNSNEVLDLDTNDIGELAIIKHGIDTMGGNSGSSILRKSKEAPYSEKIIGVHTNGGCYAQGGANQGTAILAKLNFLAAIKSCLAAEQAQ